MVRRDKRSGLSAVRHALLAGGVGLGVLFGAVGSMQVGAGAAPAEAGLSGNSALSDQEGLEAGLSAHVSNADATPSGAGASTEAKGISDEAAAEHPGTSIGAANPADQASSGEPDVLEASVRERAIQRWGALVAKDFKAAYGFELPSYRERISFEQYASQFGAAVQWHSASVVEVVFDNPSVARVRIAIDHSFIPSTGSDALRTVSWLRETWLERDGQWWHSGPG